MRFPSLAMVTFLPGCGRCVQKSVHASINLPLNYTVAHPVQLRPCLHGVQGSLSFTPGAMGRALSLWLPLAGYARSAARPEAPGLKAPLPGRGEATMDASMCKMTMLG